MIRFIRGSRHYQTRTEEQAMIAKSLTILESLIWFCGISVLISVVAQSILAGRI